MDPSGINSFENEWRKALENASETPPPNIWENIEARLDEDAGAVLPLWWKSPKLWLAAASVAAVMLVGAGIWYSGNHVSNVGEVTSNQSVNSPKTESKNLPGEADLANNDLKTDEPEKDAAGAKQETDVFVSTERPEKPVAEAKNAIKPAPRRKDGLIANAERTGSFATRTTDNGAFDQNTGDQASTSEITTNEVAVTGAPASPDAASGLVSQQESVEMLDVLAVRDLDVHVQKRYVFVAQNDMKDIEPQKPAHKEYWAGVSFMPSSFNPNVRVKEAPQAFSYQALSNRRSVSGTSEPGMSYAFQSQAGMRLSKHWSLEMGISYLQGNSSYQGGGYLLNSYNSRAANVLENALAGIAAPNADAKNTDFNTGSLYIDVAKKVDNNYRYFQLPVQAGFTLNPDKRFSYSLLGGMMANYFLNNQLESASGEMITTRSSDDVYRDVTWAATTGLRFNYRISGQWKATLTGSYQRSVTSGFRSNQSLEAHPYLYGVAWGVRYSF